MFGLKALEAHTRFSPSPCQLEVLLRPSLQANSCFFPRPLAIGTCSMSSFGSGGSSTPGTPRRPNVKYVSPAALNLERLYEQNRVRSQQRDGALSPTNDMAAANAGKSKPRLLLMGQRRSVLFIRGRHGESV